MAKKIFIWVAHPRKDSLSTALADAYQAEAAGKGAQTCRMDLADMVFDPRFEGYGPTAPALEPDLLRWQENVQWADHLLVVHPYWWGAMPSAAKAVLDRALIPGFAFRYHRRGMGWDKLLTGRTADIMITSDTPPLLDTVLYRRPGRRVLRNQVLGFCGIRVRGMVQFGSVKLADTGRIASWISRAGSMGRAAA